jgi:hypothetical protein
LAAPLDVASGGLLHSTCLRHRCRRFECLPCDPARSRVQEGGRSEELFATASFSRSRSRRTARPTPFQRRGYELSLVLLGTSKSLHRTVSTSDALFVTPRHVRVGIRTARSARPAPRSLSG